MKTDWGIVARMTLILGLGAGISEGAYVLGRVEVLDQIGLIGSYDLNAGPGPTPSQFFTDFSDFDCAVLEDFTVTSDALEIANVSGLFRAVGGFRGFQNVTGYAVNIFSRPSHAATGLTGDVASLVVMAGSNAEVTEVVDAGGNHEYGLVSLEVNVLLPGAGKYWLGISPVSASAVSGQFLLMNSGGAVPLVSGDAGATFANPEEGFGLGVTSTLSTDHAYSVSMVPEPDPACLAMLGGIGWLGKRRRQATSAEN